MRVLTPDEVAAYDVIPLELADRVRIQRWPLLPPGVGGLTWGRFVLLRRDDDRTGRRPLLAHELVHVRQFAERGRLCFGARYLAEYLAGLLRHRRHRAAYLAISAEVEARAEAAAWARRHL
ncbi:MAG: hypothetical protein D6683_14140 [Actinomyces sp.]|nr:MAG: hypothetical protein D6683_14140 [Actinomyces sp.]